MNGDTVWYTRLHDHRIVNGGYHVCDTLTASHTDSITSSFPEATVEQIDCLSPDELHLMITFSGTEEDTEDLDATLQRRFDRVTKL